MMARRVMSVQDLILAAEHEELWAERQEEERRISAASPSPRAQDDDRTAGKAAKHGLGSPRGGELPHGAVKRQRQMA